MKKTFFILISSFSFAIYAQEVKELKFDNKQFLKEISDNACKCVDSISTYNKSVDSVSANINSCIEKQVGAYQLGIKIASIKDLEDKVEEVNGKKNITINVDLNKNSKEHKKYYYEIERYLVENCPSIKKKIAANDKHNENSVSKNKESIKFYDLGLDESTNEKYEKAIEYFKKALVFDPKFAFAYDNMGVCYRKLNEFDRAIDAYEKSLEIDPNGLMPLQNIAIVYQYKKEYKKSVKTYEKLAKIDPKNPEVFYGIGQIYTQFLFDYEKALDNLCRAYNIYFEQKSPYRTDAEKLIQQVYNELKKQGKESIFIDTLKKYHISQN